MLKITYWSHACYRTTFKHNYIQAPKTNFELKITHMANYISTTLDNNIKETKQPKGWQDDFQGKSACQQA